MSFPDPPAPQPEDPGATPQPEGTAAPQPGSAPQPPPPPPPAAAAAYPSAGGGPVPGGGMPGYLVPTVPVFPNGKPMLDAHGQPVSDKSRLAAALLCWFVGVLGVHRFYVGKIGTGIAMLLTCGGLGVWALIDLIVILVGSFTDETGRRLENW